MDEQHLHGNRIALVGTVGYLLEWVLIAIAPSLPTEKLGVDPSAIVARYADAPARTALLAAWLSLVLLGRVAFMVGVRQSLRGSPRSSALADVALLAMAMSVTLEVVAYALVASGAWLADVGAEAGPIVALDAAATVIVQMIYAPIGVCLVTGSAAMLQSARFAGWLCWLGIGAGALGIVGGLALAPGAGGSDSLEGAGTLLTSLGIMGMLIWMIATSVILWRRTPVRRRPAAAAAPR